MTKEAADVYRRRAREAREQAMRETDKARRDGLKLIAEEYDKLADAVESDTRRSKRF